MISLEQIDNIERTTLRLLPAQKVSINFVVSGEFNDYVWKITNELGYGKIIEPFQFMGVLKSIYDNIKRT